MHLLNTKYTFSSETEKYYVVHSKLHHFSLLHKKLGKTQNLEKLSIKFFGYLL